MLQKQKGGAISSYTVHTPVVTHRILSKRTNYNCIFCRFCTCCNFMLQHPENNMLLTVMIIC